MKFQIYYPCKPYIVNQKWGVFNSIYSRFGFTRHNGIDCKLSEDRVVYSPAKIQITQTDNIPSGAGVFVSGITLDRYIDWRASGPTPYKVYLTFMHLKDIMCKEGDVLDIGDPIGHGDNTGFSTGNHLHLFCGRVEERQEGESGGEYRFVDEILKDANYSFDHSYYYTGEYAVDYKARKLREAEEKRLIEAKKIENLKLQIDILKQQKTLYEQIVELFIKLKNLL
jgi:hypothetical protein